MNPQSSRIQKLEGLRGLASAYIFFHHAVRIFDLPFRRFFVFGQAAVILFFIVSGFVIYYSTLGRAKDFRLKDYLIRRTRRIYPPILVALALSWFSASWVLGEFAPVRWGELFGNLFMLMDSQDHAWFRPYHENVPLWSLSFEWWFYVAFAVFCSRLTKSEERWTDWAFLVSAFGFLTFHISPNPISVVASHFFLWWCGVELAREFCTLGRISIRGQWKTAMGLLLLTLLFLSPLPSMAEVGLYISPYRYPIIEFRRYLTGLILFCGGLAWHRLAWPGFKYLVDPFKYFAPISYGVYIFHVPIQHALNVPSLHISPWLKLGISLAATCVLAYFVEVVVQKRINQFSKKLLKKKAQP